MPDYNKAKIYKLVGGGLTYYGSTVNELRKRLAQHKNNTNTCSSKLLFEPGDKVQIFLVEEYPCESKMHLNARERWWIENNECVNKYIPNRSKKEYYQANKDKLKTYSEAYREANKDKIKAYREANKEQLTAKVECECGAIVTKHNLAKHKKTKKHIKSVSIIKEDASQEETDK